MEMTLHAFQDDFRLTASGDLERSSGQTFPFDSYLTDTAGNRLTDTAGNYLVSPYGVTVYPQVLHTTEDDWKLNSE